MNSLNELINEISKLVEHDWFDYWTLGLSLAAIVVSVLATIINIWIVNKNTNKQIANQNKETYRPRLRLREIKIVKDKINERHLYAYSKQYKEDLNSITLYAEIELENIGYGIANDISFYMLNSGFKCMGIQNCNRNINQHLNSTLEITKDGKEKVNFVFNFKRPENNEEDIEIIDDDFILLICNYKDLNGNDYKILIGFILKNYLPLNYEGLEDSDDLYIYNDGKFDFYYYQENTDSYNGMINKEMYKKNYKAIIGDINGKTKTK